MSQTASPPLLKYTTRCRVPGCSSGPNGGPQEFSRSPFDVPIIGHPNDSFLTFIQKLTDHLTAKHPEIVAGGQAILIEFSRFLVVSTFQVEDPMVQAFYERVRANLYRTSRRPGVANVLSDQAIQQRVADLMEIGSDEEMSAALLDLLTDMRDLLLEQGQYAPHAPAPSPLVKP